ncbi:MAG: hypothetical protein FJZ04_02125 [Candidatus Moranbacteria bacterium]|nr:hypothetical protein [Candidatus Moranbacteria bacterium]
MKTKKTKLGLALISASALFVAQVVVTTTASAWTANLSATRVIGQTNLTSGSANQGGAAAANTLNNPIGAFEIGGKLIIADSHNHRVLIYNSVPASDNASADVIVGQQNMTSTSANQGGAAGANTLHYPVGVYSDGTRLFVSDWGNHRVLIYNTIPTSNNASADVVVGQQNMTSTSANQGGAVSANTLDEPMGVWASGGKLYIADLDNNRVLIFNSIPTANNASANVVIGQQDMTSSNPDQGGTANVNTLETPIWVQERDSKVFVSDYANHRVLIFNSIPTANNASANVVIGQANMTGEAANQGGSAAANTLNGPHAVYCDGTRLFISDYENHRILLFNSVPTSNNSSADKVIGQASFTGTSANQGGSAAANTFNKPYGMILYDKYLIAADRENNRTLLFEVGPADGLTVSPTALSYSNKKFKKTTITITAYNVNLSKKKKNWVKVRFNNKKTTIKSVQNSGDNLVVKVRLKYGKWSKKSYNLSSFKYKTSSKGAWTTKSKTDAITVQ